MSFAKVTLMGNLGRDPELRYTPQGTPICSFSLATSEKRKDNQQVLREITTWWRITFWGKQAETASQYLTRGKPVCVEGRPSLSTWTDRDGKERTTLEVHGTDLHFLPQGDSGGGGQGARRPAASPSGAPPAKKAEPAPLSLTDDDVPF